MALEGGPKYERWRKDGRTSPGRLVELKPSCSNTTVPTPKVRGRNLEIRRHGVFRDGRPSIQQPPYCSRIDDGTVGGQPEPGVGELGIAT